MFFLFGGTRVRRKHLSDMHFQCPVCEGPRAGTRRRSASWAHVFWLPLFRVGAEREVIVCASCRSEMDPERVGR